MSRRGVTRERGLTLIELMVVLGVIALLMTLLLPALGRARDVADAGRCLANLRSLAQATVMYSGAFDTYLPMPEQDSDLAEALGEDISGQLLWYNALDPYLAQQVRDYDHFDPDERNYVSFKQDPAWFDLPETSSGPQIRARDNTRTIKMNGYLRGWPDAPWLVRLIDPRLKSLSRVMLFIDGRGHDTPSLTTGNTAYADHFAATPGVVGLRHDDGVNAARLDGSAGRQVSPIRTLASGYRGWYLESAPAALWPEVIFNFRLRAH